MKIKIQILFCILGALLAAGCGPQNGAAPEEKKPAEAQQAAEEDAGIPEEIWPDEKLITVLADLEKVRSKRAQYPDNSMTYMILSHKMMELGTDLRTGGYDKLASEKQVELARRAREMPDKGRS